MKAVRCGVLGVLLACVACSGGSETTEQQSQGQTVPNSVAGQWTFKISDFECSLRGLLSEADGDEVFDVSQDTAGTLSASFTDSAGNQVVFSGQVSGDDRVSGTITVTKPGAVLAGDGVECRGKAYVTGMIGGDGTVTVIDLATREVLNTIIVGNDPGEPCLVPDRSLLFVPNTGSDTVTVIETGADTIVQTITEALALPTSCAVSPDGTELYVVNGGFVANAADVSALSIYELPSLDLLDVIEGPGGGLAAGAVLGSSGDNLFAFAPDFDMVLVWDVENGTFRGSNVLGIGPRSAAPFLSEGEDIMLVVGDRGLAAIDTDGGAKGTVDFQGYDIALPPTIQFGVITRGPFSTATTINEFALSVLFEDIDNPSGVDDGLGDAFGVDVCTAGRIALFADGNSLRFVNLEDPPNPFEFASVGVQGAHWVRVAEDVGVERTIEVSFSGLVIETQLGPMLDGPIELVSDSLGICDAAKGTYWASVGS